MASPKAIKFENEMLDLVGKIKELILTHIPEEQSEIRQEFQRAVNQLYERAHLEQRMLRKATAFLHCKLEGKEPRFRNQARMVEEIVDDASSADEATNKPG